MKEHFQKHKKKYTAFIFLIFAAIIIIIILASLAIFSSPEKPKGKIGLSLDKKTMDSGETNYIYLKAKNTGSVPLSGEFKVTVDDSSSVKLSYPEPELLKFHLLQGESIERRMDVTATSTAYKTLYKVTATIDDDNTTYARDTIILTVKGVEPQPKK